MAKAGKPALERARGDGARRWEEVDRWRKEVGLSQQQVADLCGVKLGAYSGWKSRGEMPAVVWERYEAERDARGEVADFVPATRCSIVVDRAGTRIEAMLPYASRLCENEHSTYIGHYPVFIPKVSRQRFCCAECRVSLREAERKARKKP